MHEVQPVLHEARSRADGGEGEAMRDEQRPHDRGGHLARPGRKHLHAVEAVLGRGPAARLEAVVQHERTAARFRHEADRDRRLHAPDPGGRNSGFRWRS
jgi:hypothetical protein